MQSQSTTHAPTSAQIVNYSKTQSKATFTLRATYNWPCVNAPWQKQTRTHTHRHKHQIEIGRKIKQKQYNGSTQHQPTPTVQIRALPLEFRCPSSRASDCCSAHANGEPVRGSDCWNPQDAWTQTTELQSTVQTKRYTTPLNTNRTAISLRKIINWNNWIIILK